MAMLLNLACVLLVSAYCLLIASSKVRNFFKNNPVRKGEQFTFARQLMKQGVGTHSQRPSVCIWDIDREA